MKNRPYIWLHLFLVPLLVCVLWMGETFPEESPVNGFTGAVLAFEFAASTGDLDAVLSGRSPIFLERLDRGNRIDFGFALTYSAFLFFFFRQVKKEKGHLLALAGMILAPLIGLADVLENVQLLNLTEAYRGTPVRENLVALLWKLQSFTWLKWGGLAIALLLAGGLLFERRRWFTWLISLVCLIPMLLLPVALIIFTPPFLEGFANSIFLGFFALLAYAGLYRLAG